MQLTPARRGNHLSLGDRAYGQAAERSPDTSSLLYDRALNNFASMQLAYKGLAA